MMRTKKIIALICALSMVFSMLTSFAVSAEGAKGIGIDASLSEDGKTLSAVFTADNMEGGVQAFTIEFAVPEGVTNETTKVTAGVANGKEASLMTNVSEGVLKISYFDPYGATFKDNVLFRVDMELAEAIEDSFTVQLQGKTQIKDTGAAVKISDGTMEATSVVAKNPNAPTPKPTSPTRPDEKPVPSVEPVPTAVPAEDKGVDLKGSIDKTNKVITIEAYASETEGGVQAFTIEFAVPEGVTNETAKVTAGVANGKEASLMTNVSEGVLKVSYFDPYGATFENNLLFTVDMTLSSELTAAYVATLQGKTQIKDTGAVVKVSDGTMTATSVVVSPTAEPTAKPYKIVKLSDYVAEDAADAADAAEADGKEVYITVDVTKKGDVAAVYGTDFIAVYEDKELSEAEYNNLISGYTEEKASDVINGLLLYIYNSDVTKISTTVNAIKDGSAEMIADPVEKNVGKVTPTPAPVAPKLSATVSKSNVYVGDENIKVTVKVTNPAEDGELSYEVTGDVAKDVTFDAVAGVLTFDADAKGTVKFTFTYSYTDSEGEAATKTVSKSVTIKEKSTSTSGDDDDDDNSGSSSGPIAGGQTIIVNPNVTNPFAFKDLDTVPWAKVAITKLAMKGIISGRDANTFDPNANITRAEYCQILVGAIGKSQAAANSNFTDVAKDAWYYNAVSVASELGIVSGYGDGRFAPDSLITRRDMALMTMRAAKVMNVNLAANKVVTFADADQFDYAAEAITTLANAGIINGVSETEFAPMANATRAQAAKIICDTFVK